jgi:hypothetical protein
MGAVYTVTHEDKGEAERRLAEMCAALNLRPRRGGRPMLAPASGKWMTQADAAVPDEDEAR